MKATAILFLTALASAAASAAPGNPAVLRCKHYVQGRIDVLDAELHKGTKPNVAHKLVKRREKLRNQLADCERNPDAYKKDL